MAKLKPTRASMSIECSASLPMHAEGPLAGGITQLVEWQLCKLQVAGSNPAASTRRTGRVAQLVRARP